jgi:N-acetylglucosamine-6-phosphate deacetylase
MWHGGKARMTEWVFSESVFDGASLGPVSLCIENGHIIEVAPLARRGAEISGAIMPGFLDLQVNGGGGVLLNAEPSRISEICAAHRRFGTVGIMPTVITDAPDVLIAVTDAILAAKDDVLGLHIEGPHIALSKRGTHSAEHVRPMDDNTIAAVKRLRDAGVTVLLTLAPEIVGAAAIADLMAMGVIVSLGHSDATAEEAEAGFAAGAQAVTHLFNAMSPMTHRAAGLAGVAMERAPFVGLIADGIHVEDRVLKIAVRATQGQIFLVSDAMPTVGGPDQFDLYGTTIRVEDGRLLNAEGALAGAHTTMAEGVVRLIGLGVPPKDVLHMTITNPAALIGRSDLASLVGRSVEDVIVLNQDWGVNDPLASFVGH